jgi:uncharacterized protein
LAIVAYADASLLVALIVPDALGERAVRFLDSDPTLLISDFAAAEFASAVALRVRTAALTRAEAQVAFSTFDAWSSRFGDRLAVAASDVTRSELLLRRLDLNLRAPDAINLCIAQRHDAALATFDIRMADAARALGLDVAPV